MTMNWTFIHCLVPLASWSFVPRWELQQLNMHLVFWGGDIALVSFPAGCCPSSSSSTRLVKPTRRQSPYGAVGSVRESLAISLGWTIRRIRAWKSHGCSGASSASHCTDGALPGFDKRMDGILSRRHREHQCHRLPWRTGRKRGYPVYKLHCPFGKMVDSHYQTNTRWWRFLTSHECW